MAEHTTNYKLEKQQGNEFISISGLNNNFDIIDTQLKTAQNKAEKAVTKDGNVSMDNITIGSRKTDSAIGENSISSGYLNEASGARSFAQGIANIASGQSAHAEGDGNLAKGANSHTEGASNKAYSYQSHAEGYFTQAGASDTEQGLGQFAHAEGNYTKALGNGSHAEGYQSTASGNTSHSEGSNTLASGAISHAEGTNCISSGNTSHAEGLGTVAAFSYSHSEGIYTYAGFASALYQITGFNDIAKTITLGVVSGLSVGDTINIKVTNARAIVDIPITAINGLVVTLNTSETISTQWIYAMKNASNGYPGHAEGQNSMASGQNSHAEGTSTISSGNSTHAEGYGTVANALYGHAEGLNTVASGNYSHAEGNANNAIGNASHVGGAQSEATNNSSFAHGLALSAQGSEQAVFGRFNAPNTTDLFQIGMGTSYSDRKNALIVNSVGNLITNDMEIVSNLNVAVSAFNFTKPISDFNTYLLCIYLATNSTTILKPHLCLVSRLGTASNITPLADSGIATVTMNASGIISVSLSTAKYCGATIRNLTKF